MIAAKVVPQSHLGMQQKNCNIVAKFHCHKWKGQENIDCWGALTIVSTFIYDFNPNNYCSTTFVDCNSSVDGLQNWFDVLKPIGNVFRRHFGEGKHVVALVGETIRIYSHIQLLNTIWTTI